MWSRRARAKLLRRSARRRAVDGGARGAEAPTPASIVSAWHVSSALFEYESTQGEQEDTKATSCARRLLARPRLPTFRGYAHSAPRYGLRGVGCLKQVPNAVFQQFDRPLQRSELSNPHDRDGQVHLK